MESAAADAALAALEHAADALLELNADAKQRLAEFDGKVFCVELTAPSFRFYILPHADGIAFRRAHDADAHVTLRGSPAAFAQLAHAARGGGSAGGAEISFHGDAELARDFQKFLAELELDFEELLARRIGDIPARQAARAARGVARWAEQSFLLARENAGDYLAEEKRAAVGVAEAARFGDALDELRADVDRLHARAQRLRRAYETRARETH